MRILRALQLDSASILFPVNSKTQLVEQPFGNPNVQAEFHWKPTKCFKMAFAVEVNHGIFS